MKQRAITPFQITIIFVTVIAFTLEWVAANLVWVTTPSIKPTFLWKTHQPQAKIGDYIMFTLKHEIFEMDKVITKKITCSAGDAIKYLDEMFFCNGQYIGKKREIRAKSKLIPVIELNQIIPEGYVFVQGSHPLSFDSRNFGLVKVNDNTVLLKPLI